MGGERFLVDTTVWVHYLRGTEAALKSRLASLALEDRAVTCALVMHEILRGAISDREFMMLQDLFLALPQVSIDGDVWESAWKNAYLLKKKGLTIPMADVVLASAAMRHHLTLLHADRHFTLIARHLDLKVAGK
jgi:predicted nucleic acid-binding protein